MAPVNDVREFADGFIYDEIRPLVDNAVEMFRGSLPEKSDPDFYVSILTEEEEEVNPGDNVWILQQSVVLVCDISERDGAKHGIYRGQVREALIKLTGIQNFAIKDRGKWYGMFIRSVEKANQEHSYGDIFYIETRVCA